jgi:ABC-type nitrate/sulfonate/bicarbonate transport system substrate-binding protein
MNVAGRVLLLSIAVGAWVSAGCAARSVEPAAVSTRQAPVPVRASFSAPVFSQSPIALAQEAGYYAEQGLDVSYTYVRMATQNVAGLLTGELDVSIMGGTAPLNARLGGADLILIGATKPYFAGAIMASPEITTPAELRGKRIGIGNKGGNPDFMARAMLLRLGLEPDRDVALLSTGGNPETVAALVAGSVDAGSLIPPGDEQARNLGFHTLFDVTAARVPFPATVVATSGAALADRADVLERYLRAYAQAAHRFRTDKEFALQVGAAFTQSDDVAANEAGYEVERAIIQADLDLPLAAVQSGLDLMKPEDPRAATARPEEFVDLRLLQRVKQSGFFDRLGRP